MSLIKTLREIGKTISPDAKSSPEAIKEFGKLCQETFTQTKSLVKNDIIRHSEMMSDPKTRILNADKGEERNPTLLERLDGRIGSEARGAIIGALTCGGSLAAYLLSVKAVTPEFLNKVMEGQNALMAALSQQPISGSSLAVGTIAGLATAGAVGGWVKGKDIEASSIALEATPRRVLKALKLAKEAPAGPEM